MFVAIARPIEGAEVCDMSVHGNSFRECLFRILHEESSEIAELSLEFLSCFNMTFTPDLKGDKYFSEAHMEFIELLAKLEDSQLKSLIEKSPYFPGMTEPQKHFCFNHFKWARAMRLGLQKPYLELKCHLDCGNWHLIERLITRIESAAKQEKALKITAKYLAFVPDTIAVHDLLERIPQGISGRSQVFTELKSQQDLNRIMRLNTVIEVDWKRATLFAASLDPEPTPNWPSEVENPDRIKCSNREAGFRTIAIALVQRGAFAQIEVARSGITNGLIRQCFSQVLASAIVYCKCADHPSIPDDVRELVLELRTSTMEA